MPVSGLEPLIVEGEGLLVLVRGLEGADRLERGDELSQLVEWTLRQVADAPGVTYSSVKSTMAIRHGMYSSLTLT
jgi:hypothetical protein